jgi:5-formyltetrahydrofolate cyclo-ligase
LPSGGADPKRRLRETMAARRRGVATEVAGAAAEAVAAAVAGDARVRAAGCVGLYADSDGELPTRPLFDALGALGLRRLLPRVRDGALEWGEIGAWEDLGPGRWGISEPAGASVRPPGEGDVVLLPGLAFDAAGHRLGRGGGHYDRAFPRGGSAPWLIGVGYAFQCIDAVPHDSRDRRVDAIVTEQGLVWRAGTG